MPLVVLAAVLFVILAVVVAALVLDRDENEVFVDTVGASLPMTTDAEIKAALADVAAAQRAHFDKAHTFTTSFASLRAAQAKAPLAVGHYAEEPGLVYMHLGFGTSKVRTVFYLAARGTSGECLYLKGEYASTYEATNADCAFSLTVEYGPSTEQRKLDDALLRHEDMGAGWTAEDVTHETSAAWEPETSACLGLAPALPVLTTGAATFTRGSTEVEAQVSQWSTAEYAQQDLGVIDHPQFGSCFVAELKSYVAPETIPGLRRFTVSLSNRGEFPGVPGAKRARFRLMLEGDNAGASAWVDYVAAVRGRVRVDIAVTNFDRAPDDAVTAKAMQAMLSRVTA